MFGRGRPPSMPKSREQNRHTHYFTMNTNAERSLRQKSIELEDKIKAQSEHLDGQLERIRLLGEKFDVLFSLYEETKDKVEVMNSYMELMESRK